MELSTDCEIIFSFNWQLKNTIDKWLNYSSVYSRYNKYYFLYELLSKEYLNKQFPEVKSRVEFMEAMDSDGIYNLKYLEISNIRFKSNREFELGTVFILDKNRITQEMEKTHNFIKEDDEWKYNGFNANSIKVIK